MFIKNILSKYLFSFLLSFVLATVFVGDNDALADEASCPGVAADAAGAADVLESVDCATEGVACVLDGTACVWDDDSPASSGAPQDSTAKFYDKNAFVTVLCNVLKMVTGNGGKAFAAFAIISLGIGFFTGKVSWSLMIGVTAGVGALFGAPTIVSAISGKKQFDCSAGTELDPNATTVQ